MSIIHEKTRRFAANSIFPSFFHVALGLVLAQVGAAQIRGAWRLHVFLGIVGLALSAHVLFRVRTHWTEVNINPPLLRPYALGWYLLLLAAGACVGLVAASGSALFLGMAAAFTYLLPWTRIAVCRARFFVAAAAILAGAFASLVVYGRPVQPLHFIVGGWMLYILPTFMQVLVLAVLDRGYRIREPRLGVASDHDVHVPGPHKN